MSQTLRIAVRKFEPFAQAIEKQFASFLRASGSDARLEAVQMDLEPLHDALFEKGGLRSGAWDIAFLPTDWIAEAQASGLIEDLLPHLKERSVSDFPDGWTPSLLDLQSFGGGFWGMPYHDGPQCLIYRRDLLDGHGLAVPTTWDEFHDVARRLHSPENGRFGTILALYPDGHNTFYDFCIQSWTRGGEPFDANGRPALVTDACERALDFIRTLATDEAAIAPDPTGYDSVRSGLLFCEGKVALMTNWFGFAALGETMADSAVRGLVDVAPIPAGDGGRSVSLNVFWMLAIASGSDKKALAWEFLRHAATPDMDRLTTLEGAIGVRRSTWRDPEVNARIPYFHRLDWLHEHARALPRHPRLADIAHAVDEMLAAALAGSRPSRALLEAAQARIERIVG